MSPFYFGFACTDIFPLADLHRLPLPTMTHLQHNNKTRAKGAKAIAMCVNSIVQELHLEQMCW
jgi:hypothetical protein